MAELLVFWASTEHPEDAERFDVIVVYPDGHEWGLKEGAPNFLRVSLPGISVEQAEFLLDTERDSPQLFFPETGDPMQQVKTRHRAWRIVESRIPPPIMADLEAAFIVGGKYVVQNPDNLLAWLEKKLDGSGRGAW